MQFATVREIKFHIVVVVVTFVLCLMFYVSFFFCSLYTNPFSKVQFGREGNFYFLCGQENGREEGDVGSPVEIMQQSDLFK